MKFYQYNISPHLQKKLHDRTRSCPRVIKQNAYICDSETKIHSKYQEHGNQRKDKKLHVALRSEFLFPRVFHYTHGVFHTRNECGILDLGRGVSLLPRAATMAVLRDSPDFTRPLRAERVTFLREKKKKGGGSENIV